MNAWETNSLVALSEEIDSLQAGDGADGVPLFRVVCCLNRSAEVVVAKTAHTLDPDSGLVTSDPRKLKLLVLRVDDESDDQRDRSSWIRINEQLSTSEKRAKKNESDAAQRVLRERELCMKPYIDPVERAKAFQYGDGFRSLIRETVRKHDVSKAAVLYWLKLLITWGFSSASLSANYDKCGAPGVWRPWGAADPGETPRKKPGRQSAAFLTGGESKSANGVCNDVRRKIICLSQTFQRMGLSQKDIYDRVIQDICGVVQLDERGKICSLSLTEQNYFSFDQHQYIIHAALEKDMRALGRTTQSHAEKNNRGLTGRARDGVAGPGHKFAIDSTVADVHLRSAIDRAYLVGRAIVYWIIDVWSTVAVGYYACLASPSWRNAACSILCTVIDSENYERLFGFPRLAELDPVPTLAATWAADRGEYLSEGAHETAGLLGMALEYNQSYRADFRGGVERFHRIAKDHAFGFVPGAFDTRRRELEARSNARVSQLTLHEYSQYLGSVQADKNNSVLSDSNLFAEAVGEGYPPTAAGMWKWGHDKGLGYRAAAPSLETLVSATAVPKTATWCRNGPRIGGLRYDAVGMEALTRRARITGNFDSQAFVVPAAVRAAFVHCGDSGLLTRNIAPRELVDEESSWFDHSDARILKNAAISNHELEATRARIERRNKNEELFEDARAATDLAETTVRDRRALENNIHDSQPTQRQPPVSALPPPTQPESEDPLDRAIEAALASKHG